VEEVVQTHYKNLPRASAPTSKPAAQSFLESCPVTKRTQNVSYRNSLTPIAALPPTKFSASPQSHTKFHFLVRKNGYSPSAPAGGLLIPFEMAETRHHPTSGARHHCKGTQASRLEFEQKAL